MFCQKCGNQINSNAEFCPKCGKPLSPQANASGRVSSVQQRQQIRQDELDEIDKMINYFSKKQNQYDEYDDVCIRLNPNYIKMRIWLPILGIVMGFFGILNLANRSFLYGTFFTLEAIGLVFTFILNIRARHKNSIVSTKRYYDLSDELYQHYLNYGSCFVSPDYSNPSNLIAIKQTIQSGRADTITDALNILLDDQHKATMEAYSAQTLASAQQAAESAGIAANNTAVAAVFSAANFFYNVKSDKSKY